VGGRIKLSISGLISTIIPILISDERKHSMVDIPWERTADGMAAEMKEGESPRRAIFPVLSLLLAAEQKMRELWTAPMRADTEEREASF
jgi:hypothetical protein